MVEVAVATNWMLSELMPSAAISLVLSAQVWRELSGRYSTSSVRYEVTSDSMGYYHRVREGHADEIRDRAELHELRDRSVVEESASPS